MHSGMLALAVAALLSVIPSTSDEPTDEKGPDDESHCVVFVTGRLEDGELVTSKPDCFSSLALADAWAAAGAPNSILEADGSEDVAAASSFVLGRHYDGFNGSGSSIAVVGSSCTGGHWNTGSSWANRISSSYNGCPTLRHYDYPNKGGGSQYTSGAGTIDNLGYMNNDAESVAYLP